MKISKSLALGAALASAMAISTAPANAGMNPVIGDMMIVAFDYCPRGWLSANGQIVSTADYESLFSVIDTNYGSTDQSNFKLPDMRGRVPMGAGIFEGNGDVHIVGNQYNGGEGAAYSQERDYANYSPLATNPTSALTFCVAYLGHFPERN